MNLDDECDDNTNKGKFNFFSISLSYLFNLMNLDDECNNDKHNDDTNKGKFFSISLSYLFETR